MTQDQDKLESYARKAAERIRGVIGRLSDRDIRNDLLDYIVETLGIEDDDEVEAVYTRAREIAAAPSPAESKDRLHRRNRGDLDQSLVSAPFRFVALNEKVALAEDAVGGKAYAHDRPLRAGFSGRIDIALAFETPMLIGTDGTDPQNQSLATPLRLGVNYVVPGSSLRGLLRTAMETVCRARLVQVNKHHRYGVRDFNHPLFAEGKDGKKRLGWEGLGAGWLHAAVAGDPEKKDGDSDYVIKPCKKRVVRIRALPKRLNGGKDTNTGDWHLTWLTTKLAARYAMAGCKIGGTAQRPILDFSDETKKTFVKTSAGVKTTDPMRDDYVVEASEPGSAGGWLVFSSNLGTIRPRDRLSKAEETQLIAELDRQDTADPGETGYYKKREYVFIDDSAAKPVRLKQDVFDRFELINSKPAKTKRLPDGSWAIMRPTLDDGRRIPIFFTGSLGDQDSKFDIGLTRLFKLAHENSVGDVLARSAAHKLVPGKPDMVTALFGHVFEENEYPGGVEPNAIDLQRKGRISFGFFTLHPSTPAHPTDIVEGVAMGPRASFAPFYLAGPVKDWTDEDERRGKGRARLAGRKMYFPRFPVAANAQKEIVTTISRRTGNQAEQKSRQRFLVPIAPGTELIFTGTIRLHNVTEVEVGALLWTLTHGGDPAKPYRHMMGRAKTAGAGQMRVKSLHLKLVPHLPPDAPAAVAAEWESHGNTREGWVPQGSLSMAPFLRAFEKHMRQSDTAWPAVPDMLEFLGASDPIQGKKLVDEMKADYPDLKDFKNIRDAVKADTTKLDPGSSPERLLPAPRVNTDRVRNLPYQKR